MGNTSRSRDDMDLLVPSTCQCVCVCVFMPTVYLVQPREVFWTASRHLSVGCAVLKVCANTHHTH